MANDKDDKKRLRGTTPEFRGNYVTLVKPRSPGEGADPKYSIVMALPKDHPFWRKLEAQIRLAAEAKFDGKVPKNLKSPIRDGDEVEYGDFGGKLFVSFSSADRPETVDVGLDPITERSELYSGAWYRVSYNVYGWHYTQLNRKGVSLGLNNVMKIRDDKAFSGRSSAADDFADLVDKTRDQDDDDEDPTE